jgi:hypothetical protein
MQFEIESFTAAGAGLGVAGRGRFADRGPSSFGTASSWRRSAHFRAQRTCAAPQLFSMEGHPRVTNDGSD